MFEKILIANRGEIAVRIIRACRDLDVRTVAVYSEADRESLHVRLADEAYLIGPAPSSESYLRIDKLLDAAGRSGARAIHPGYGFLSENALFARAVTDAGLVFIGPSAEAMALMGDKARARAVAVKAGVPVVPGTEPLASLEIAIAEAERIGFPLLVKATGGGGGKGMRRVDAPRALASAFEQARSEAQSSFGNPSVFLEKCIERPRHIELQIVGDGAGSVVHLFERECSIQRRHQKLIEESPSPFLDEELRTRMGEAAVALARVAGYRNAGTVEFLVADDRSFYFLEMNARLQVEHPVTELVTGVDLVRVQLDVAAGRPLPFRQEDLRQRGWAMEFRITAEDPFENFIPSAGQVELLRAPEGPGVRHDSGLYTGLEVTPHYDPLVAKLVIAGDDRAHCIARARRAIEEYRIQGIATTLPFFQRMLRDERFVAGEMDTGFVDRHWMPELSVAPFPGEAEILEVALAAAGAAVSWSSRESVSSGHRESTSTWKLHGLREQMGSRI